jgi:hypothetical protein
MIRPAIAALAVILIGCALLQPPESEANSPTPGQLAEMQVGETTLFDNLLAVPPETRAAAESPPADSETVCVAGVCYPAAKLETRSTTEPVYRVSTTASGYGCSGGPSLVASQPTTATVVTYSRTLVRGSQPVRSVVRARPVRSTVRSIVRARPVRRLLGRVFGCR